MTSRASLQRQIEDIETRLRALQDRLSDRFSLSARPQVWLAKTVSEVVSGEEETEEREYPSGTSSTFGIALRRPYFTERIGNQTLEGPLGDDRPQRYALAWPKRYVPENTDAMVVEIDGQYYFVPDGRAALIVHLDEDLPEASMSDPGDGSEVECVVTPNVGATIWTYTEQGLLCPTEGRLEFPEGVFNFQTDKVHKRNKSTGEPNLMYVYRDAESGRWAPECSTCDTPTVTTSVNCGCMSGGDLCRLFVHFRDVKAVGLNDEIGAPPNNTWPDYCNFLNFPRGGLRDVCGNGCLQWNRSGGFELKEGNGQQTTTFCRYGMYQWGSTATTEFDTSGNYPCIDPDNPDDLDTGIEVDLFCPDPWDGSGTAVLRLYKGQRCQLFELFFDDMDYSLIEVEPSFQVAETENRATRVNIEGFDVGNPFDPFDFCHCLLETTRDDLDQGNFNASTGTPNLQHGATGGLNVPGHNYTVNVAGTHDFGDGGVSLFVGDVVVYDDEFRKWIVIPNIAGAANNQQFALVEITRFIDSDGCDWTDMLRGAKAKLVFEACPL